jgi:beta-lactamase class A
MRVSRRLVASAVSLAVSFAVGSPAGAVNVPGPLADFQAQLSAFSLRAPGHVGVMVQDVTTGMTTSVNAGAEMPAASTIKIPVMVEVFRQLGTQKFDLNTRVTLLRSDKDWGSGDLAGSRVGSSYPVSRLLALMIDVSDNTATNMLIRLVGRPHINQEMEDLGLRHTRLTDFIRSEGPHIRWALRSSPADMAHLLRQMAKKQLIDEWSSGEMLAILRGQQHNSLLPEPLPEGTDIAHKTGTLHDTLNDVGIVYEGSAPYVIAVMTTDLRTLSSGRRFIRGVSRLAYDALGKFATWRGVNDFNPDAESEHAAPTDAAPPTADQQMWAPQNVPAPVAAPATTPTPAP